MGGAGVQQGPEQHADSPRRRAWWIAAIITALVALTAVWLVHSGLLTNWLTPGFQVTQVDPAEKKMSLRRANHTYIVQCADACGVFRKGTTYHMQIVGEQLRYNISHQEIMLPILEEQVGFTTPGGRG